MSGMDQFLAEIYGTNKTASANEDLEKEASVELFMKLAGEQNIDLANMPDTQVQALYNGWVEKSAQMQANQAGQKVASDDNDADDKKKREEAAKEHEEKKAAAEKVAEADFLGRVMAHAYTQELQKIAAQAGGSSKEAEMPEAFRKAMEAKRGDKSEDKSEGKDDKKDDKKDKEASASIARSKKASAIDELAAGAAVNMAREAGFNADEAGRKVAAVIELGLVGESEKIASAPTVDAAVSIRALEFLERAGYPVTWNQ